MFSHEYIYHLIFIFTMAALNTDGTPIQTGASFLPDISPFKILSINCQGLGCPKRRALFFSLLSINYAFDMIFLQETHAPFGNKWSQEWLNVSGGKSHFPHAKSNNSAGVAILFHKSFIFQEHSYIADPNGHFISMSISQNDFHYQLINVYGPGQQKEAFYESLEDYILSTGPLLISGDFNFTENGMDREGPGKFSNRNQKGSLAFSKIKSRFNLKDIWRSLNPKKQQFTYFGPEKQKGQVKSRIDRTYISNHFDTKTSQADILPFGLSDHYMISATIQLKHFKVSDRGPGYPKMNIQVLDYEPFKNDL